MAATELQKHILDHIKLKAEEDAEAELFTQYGNDPDNMISDMQREASGSQISEYMMEMKEMQAQLAGGGEEGGEDPVVALKARELQQRAAKDRADLILSAAPAKRAMRIQEDAQANDERIVSQEKIAAERAAVARESTHPKG